MNNKSWNEMKQEMNFTIETHIRLFHSHQEPNKPTHELTFSESDKSYELICRKDLPLHMTERVCFLKSGPHFCPFCGTDISSRKI